MPIISKIREELLQEPQGGRNFKVYAVVGFMIFVIGLLLIYLSTDQVARSLAVGQAGVGLSITLRGIAETVSQNRRRLSIILRAASVVMLVAGVVAVVARLLLA